MNQWMEQIEEEGPMKQKKKVSKQEGSMLNFLPVLLSIVIGGLIIIVLLSWQKQFDTKDQIDQIARKYILRMEAKGYLDSQNQTTLINELQHLNMTTIDLDDTTTTPVTYGSEIKLSICGFVEVEDNSFSDWLTLNSNRSQIEVINRKTSTAKN